MSDLIAHYFTNEGFTPMMAQDGETAVQMIQKKAPELVLLDVMLPGMNGWDVCKAIRKLYRFFALA
jgi:two-component system response regulator MtrA